MSKAMLQSVTGLASKSYTTLLIAYVAESKDPMETVLKTAIDIANESVPNILTRDNTITSLRAAARGRWPDVDKEYIYNILSMNEEDRQLKISLQSERLKKKLSDVKDVKSDDVSRVAKKLATSRDWADNVILLMISTGRRFIEILRVTPVPHKSPYKDKVEHIIITRTAKTPKHLQERLAFRIPLLFINYKRMVEAFEIVRKGIPNDYDKLTNSELTAKYNRQVNGVVRDLLGVTGHSLRSVYANMAYSIMCDESTDRGLYISQILGHNNIASSANYRKINITKSEHTRIINAMDILAAGGTKPTYANIKAMVGCGSSAITRCMDYMKRQGFLI